MEARPEILARYERHDEVHEAFALVDAVDRNDVRMAQLRRGLGFLEKTRPDLATERQLGREELDGNVTLQALVFRLVDDPHAATSDLTVELIVGAEDALDMRAQLSVRGRDDGIRHRVYPFVGGARGVV